jgi:protein arginine kinase
MGDFYQISNQITLGKSEEELIAQVSEVAQTLIEYERKARDFLVENGLKELHDRVSRAFGVLCTAQTISSEETLALLSSVRMGINLGLIRDVEIPTVNKLFIHTQPAHLQKIRGTVLNTAGRNAERKPTSPAVESQAAARCQRYSTPGRASSSRPVWP